MAYNSTTTVITIVITISLWKYPDSGTTSMQGMSIGFQNDTQSESFLTYMSIDLKFYSVEQLVIIIVRYYKLITIST